MARSVLEQTGIPDAFGDGVGTPPYLPSGYSTPTIDQGVAAIETRKASLADWLKAIGRTTPGDVLAQIPGAAGDLGKAAVDTVVGDPLEKAGPWFQRSAFIIVGALFILAGLFGLMAPGYRRAASEGFAEGIGEALNG